MINFYLLCYLDVPNSFVLNKLIFFIFNEYKDFDIFADRRIKFFIYFINLINLLFF